MKRAHTLAALLTGIALTAAQLPAGGRLPARAAGAGSAVRVNYLALGDSLTVGYQPDPRVPWTRGWVYQLRDYLAKSGPVELTNLGHRGECTDTFITGGIARDCPTKHVDSPSQLAGAVGFIKDHPGQVRLITVEIGGNDLNGHKAVFFNSTPAQQHAFLARTLPLMAHNWGVIFGTLRTSCPGCEIVALNQFSPFPSGSVKADLGALLKTYTGLLTRVAAQAKVRVADVYTPFVGHELTYTWIGHGDIHATTLGYAVIAAIVERTIGAVTPAP